MNTQHIDLIKLKPIEDQRLSTDSGDHWLQLVDYVSNALNNVIQREMIHPLMPKGRLQSELVQEACISHHVRTKSKAMIYNQHKRNALQTYAAGFHDFSNKSSKSRILKTAATRLIFDNIDYLDDLYKSAVGGRRLAEWHKSIKETRQQIN